MNNKKKKIVHITTVHHPLDTRIYFKQCMSLHKAGFDLTLIVTEHEDLREINPKLFKIITIPKSRNRLIRIIKGNYHAYKQARKINAKIYHFHDPELMITGRLLKKKNNIVIYDIHEDYETSINQKRYIIKPFRKIISKFYNLIEKLLIKDFKLILAEKYYKEKYPEGKCILNYPIIENNKIVNEYMVKNNNSNMLIYTGNVTIDRGALIHAKIPSIVEDVKVKFVGKCNRELADIILKLNQGMEERIEIIGIDKYVPREVIDNEYRNPNILAGLAIFPYTDHYAKKELTKFFEYMYAGIPIICSNFPHWSRFIDKYKCGITVDPYDDNEIKNAINFLKNNIDEAKRMGQRGRNAVIRYLNWEKEEEKLINAYKDFLKEIEEK